MAESNPMRWVVLAFIAAGLFAIVLVTVVDDRSTRRRCRRPRRSRRWTNEWRAPISR